MTKTEMAKIGTQLVSSIGIAKILGGIVARNAPQRNLKEKLCVLTGGVVVGGLIIEHSNVYLGQKVEQFSEWLSGNQDK